MLLSSDREKITKYQISIDLEIFEPSSSSIIKYTKTSAVHFRSIRLRKFRKYE